MVFVWEKGSPSSAREAAPMRACFAKLCRKLKCFRPGGGGLPYERGGAARRLA